MTTSTLASERGALPRFRNGDPTAPGLRHSPPIWTLGLGRGRPYLRAGNLVFSPKKMNPRNTGIRIQHLMLEVHERNGKRPKNIHESKHSSIFAPLRLDLGRSEGQLPGRPEHPRKSGNAAAYSESRKSNTADGKPRAIEERRTRRNIADRQKGRENANTGKYLDANSLQFRLETTPIACSRITVSNGVDHLRRYSHAL